MKHFVIVAVLVLIVTVGVSAALGSIPLLPIQASAQAVPIDHLFGLHVKVISFLFALIVVFLLYSVVVFRRRPGDTGEGDHFEGHTGLEIIWTLAPLATVLYFSYLGAQALAETRRVDPQAMEVKVIASQWSWRFEYPEYGVTSTTLNLPLNRQVLLKLTSTDVIHSFWVPEFRVKQDALPGANMARDLRITPTLLGEYKVRCAELCGLSHAYMESPVVVMEAAAFDSWISGQAGAVPESPAERGKKWAAQFGCAGCHSIDGSVVVGPSWKGLYGKQETLADGTTVPVDDAYLLESIHEPGAKIVKGFQPIMPSLASQMTDEQITDVIAYIKSLK
ncbi:MAG: cytochrome c oxidase subunit II [Ardenticatenaceae bacterium]|nr:cytochrome c oxidase subunit II [Ardenticatenaceae bacterium]HBY92387.1 cytochrome c oxidase subunit II [Chloroflexota bacterium]